MTSSPATTTLLYSSVLAHDAAPVHHVPAPPLAIAWALASVIVGILAFAVIDGILWRREALDPIAEHRKAHERSWASLHPGVPMPPCAYCMTTRPRS